MNLNTGNRSRSKKRCVYDTAKRAGTARKNKTGHLHGTAEVYENHGTTVLQRTCRAVTFPHGKKNTEAGEHPDNVMELLQVEREGNMNYLEELEKIRQAMEESLEKLDKEGLLLERDYLYEELIAVNKSIKRIKKVQRSAKRSLGFDKLFERTIKNKF